MVELQKFCSWHGSKMKVFFFILLLLYIYILFFLQILLYHFYIFILRIIDNFVSSMCYWKSEYEGKGNLSRLVYLQKPERRKAKGCKVYFLGYNTNPHIETRTIAGGRLRCCRESTCRTYEKLPYGMRLSSTCLTMHFHTYAWRYTRDSLVHSSVAVYKSTPCPWSPCKVLVTATWKPGTRSFLSLTA